MISLPEIFIDFLEKSLPIPNNGIVRDTGKLTIRFEIGHSKKHVHFDVYVYEHCQKLLYLLAISTLDSLTPAEKAEVSNKQARVDRQCKHAAGSAPGRFKKLMDGIDKAIVKKVKTQARRLVNESQFNQPGVEWHLMSPYGKGWALICTGSEVPATLVIAPDGSVTAHSLPSSFHKFPSQGDLLSLFSLAAELQSFLQGNNK